MNGGQPKGKRNELQTARLGVVPVVAALVFLQSLPCTAQDGDDHSGITEYEIACMPCHGPDGKGNGPAAQGLTKPPADLTRIAKANGGRFPAKKVVEIIDGREIVASHGARDMPVWGERYRAAIETGENPDEVERNARAQINALLAYIETIQEK
jgi:mono/diheme cytochrome c family protein